MKKSVKIIVSIFAVLALLFGLLVFAASHYYWLSYDYRDNHVWTLDLSEVESIKIISNSHARTLSKDSRKYADVISAFDNRHTRTVHGTPLLYGDDYRVIIETPDRTYDMRGRIEDGKRRARFIVYDGTMDVTDYLYITVNIPKKDFEKIFDTEVNK